MRQQAKHVVDEMASSLSTKCVHSVLLETRGVFIGPKIQVNLPRKPNFSHKHCVKALHAPGQW